MQRSSRTLSPTSSTETVSLTEVLSALSRALDLTEGATVGHTMRSCLIGMRLAEEAGIGAAELCPTALDALAALRAAAGPQRISIETFAQQE